MLVVIIKVFSVFVTSQKYAQVLPRHKIWFCSQQKFCRKSVFIYANKTVTTLQIQQIERWIKCTNRRKERKMMTQNLAYCISFSMLFSLPSNAFLGMHLMATSLWVLFSSARTTSEKAPLKHRQRTHTHTDTHIYAHIRERKRNVWECEVKWTRSESLSRSHSSKATVKANKAEYSGLFMQVIFKFLLPLAQRYVLVVIRPSY